MQEKRNVQLKKQSLVSLYWVKVRAFLNSYTEIINSLWQFLCLTIYLFVGFPYLSITSLLRTVCPCFVLLLAEASKNTFFRPKVIGLKNIVPISVLCVQEVVTHYIISYYIKWVTASWTYIILLCNLVKKLDINLSLWV